jgi:hypothetical protein
VRGRLNRYWAQPRKLDRNRDSTSAGNWADTEWVRAQDAGQILGATTEAIQEQGQHIRGKVGRYTERVRARKAGQIQDACTEARQKHGRQIRGKVGQI